MLRVTVELLPGGGLQGRRTLATADIGRIRSGAVADYQIDMEEDLLATPWSGTLQDYPRWSASVWDLVVRSIAVALTGKEELLPRPVQPRVPVHLSADRTSYIRLDEIPEPTRSYFAHNIRASARPIVGEAPDPLGCAYSWDWNDFLAGQR
ncbi:hypothetical protein [Cupriavidus pinatubonensis]|uniref:Uncharacterized protein n=1 Tax=Cupriavidus pinatubonensis TaxID=248026 RepID=A0ABN7Z408_9BURK|nr:hypothetical protein [Cupriavidus pinatubonensis]CAG9180662.1 hypothetical protein LMG23994_04471 [Cupriavidus pinatubonensis]